ncbi:hypothetical protein AB0C77_00875 [Streptomyces sp. NPDC048629]|uniref:hypothetical protein n=1 Tax=Streptomyces sp. NPDC048629 TaxID=3154824 RepID=UPI0034436D66
MSLHVPPPGSPFPGGYPGPPEPERDSAGLGILTALVVALIGGTVYGLVAGEIRYEIGWAAIGVGFLTGYSASKATGGPNPFLTAVAAVFSIGGVYLGELIVAAVINSEELNIPVTELFLSHSELVTETWEQIFKDTWTLLFFALAAVGAVAGARKASAD